jgi:hypothetical protein
MTQVKLGGRIPRCRVLYSGGFPHATGYPVASALASLLKMPGAKKPHCYRVRYFRLTLESLLSIPFGTTKVYLN